jgi:ribonuclease HI
MSNGSSIHSSTHTDEEATLSALAEAIQQLTPEQRRRLLRRLRTSGVLDNDEVLTDRDRLRVAPALGLLARRRVRRSSPKTRPAGPVLVPANPPTEEIPQAPHTARPIEAKSEPYRSAVSGKVVRGAPSNETMLDPHGMAPLPGQAPEQAIVIIFDGGSRGNPGQGYGSYALRWPGQSQQIVQLRFGDRVTTNEAEYDTLVAALETVVQRLQDSGAAPKTARVEIRGDSLLVVNQVKGHWEASEARLQVRRERVRELLGYFGSWQLTHYDRDKNASTPEE